jgi:hypothetical protein
MWFKLRRFQPQYITDPQPGMQGHPHDQAVSVR